MTHERFTREHSGPPGARETRWTWLLADTARRDADPGDLQHARSRAVRRAVLLLVPDGLDPAQRADHVDRLPRDEAGRVMIFAAVDGVELAVFITLFGLVTVLGFVASRWRAASRSTTSTSGGSAGATSAPGSPGSWSAATSTPRTRSSPCPRCCSASARSASSPCRTRSSSTRWCSWCAAAVVGLAPPRLRHAGRLRPRPLRLALARAR